MEAAIDVVSVGGGGVCVCVASRHLGTRYGWGGNLVQSMALVTNCQLKNTHTLKKKKKKNPTYIYIYILCVCVCMRVCVFVYVCVSMCVCLCVFEGILFGLDILL